MSKIMDDAYPNPNPWQSVAVAATLSGWSRSTIYKWAREGSITSRQGARGLEIFLTPIVAHARTVLIHYDELIADEEESQQ